MKKGILIAYGELFLKSEGVRMLFQQKLVNNIKGFLPKAKLHVSRERIFIEKASKAKLKEIFGIAWIADAFYFENLKELLSFDFKKYIQKKETFAIRMKHDRETIEKVAKLIDSKVELDKPKKELFIEKRGKAFFIYFKKIKGAGGLPVGSGGKVLAMVSGGIDSVPAAYLAAKRGAETIWVHFHSFPLVSNSSIEKTKELAKVFEKYQKQVKVHFIPFQDFQMKVKAKAPENYRVLLYRRKMFQLAEKIAKKEGCDALVTGESLGQVSSQTLANMRITGDGAKLPILRPLIGLDKEEIIEIAKKIGTFNISIKPQEDCCTLFVPKHQTAKGDLVIVKKLEKDLKRA